MLSKSKISFIKSLQVKKYRQEEQCFLIHGAKTVDETLASDFEILTLLGTEEFLKSIEGTIIGKVKEIIEVSEKELTSVGSVETNNSALAVVKMPDQKMPVLIANQFYLVLDDIRDPGNLGTINPDSRVVRNYHHHRFLRDHGCLQPQSDQRHDGLVSSCECVLYSAH